MAAALLRPYRFWDSYYQHQFRIDDSRHPAGFVNAIVAEYTRRARSSEQSYPKDLAVAGANLRRHASGGTGGEPAAGFRAQIGRDLRGRDKETLAGSKLKQLQGHSERCRPIGLQSRRSSSKSRQALRFSARCRRRPGLQARSDQKLASQAGLGEAEPDADAGQSQVQRLRTRSWS